jgi:hypothetical protein
MLTTPHLCEEQTFSFDEGVDIDPPFTDRSADWGSDPMEILQAKQERALALESNI